MDLQTLIVAILVGLAAAIVVRAFTRQFTSRGQKGCASCGHSQPGATRDEQLIQVETIRE